MSDNQQIENSIDQARKMVERKNQIEKLTSNREFRKVILDGYFVDEASRLAGISGDPLHAREHEDIMLSLKAISKLRLFLSNQIRMGQVAEAELHEYNEALDEMRAAEAESTDDEAGE